MYATGVFRVSCHSALLHNHKSSKLIKIEPARMPFIHDEHLPLTGNPRPAVNDARGDQDRLADFLLQLEADLEANDTHYSRATGVLLTDPLTSVTSFLPIPDDGLTCATACMSKVFAKSEDPTIGSWGHAFRPDGVVQGTFSCRTEMTADSLGVRMPARIFGIDTLAEYEGPESHWRVGYQPNSSDSVRQSSPGDDGPRSYVTSCITLRITEGSDPDVYDIHATLECVKSPRLGDRSFTQDLLTGPSTHQSRVTNYPDLRGAVAELTPNGDPGLIGVSDEKFIL